MNPRTTHLSLFVMTMLLAVAPAAMGDSIQLRSRAVVSDAAVRLSDVAALEGELALGLKDTIVIRLDASKSTAVLTHETLKAALAMAQVNWARISLKGFEKCDIVMEAVTAGEGRTEEKTVAAIVAPASPIRANPENEIAADGQDTLRARLVDWVRSLHGTAGHDIRIQFADRDGPVLAATVGQDRLIFTTPSLSKLGRVPVTIQRLRNEKLMETQRVMLDVTQRHLTVVAVRPISKGDSIAMEDVEVREVFADFREDKLIKKIDDAVGLVAIVAIREGSLIRSDEAKPALMVRRNEQVRVQALAGGIVVTTQARALEDGGEGQMIQVRNERSRETFTVRVIGVRQVLIIVDAPAAPASGNDADSAEKQAKTTRS